MKSKDSTLKVTILSVVGILLLITAVSGVTFALWQQTSVQSGTNVITTGCFNVTLTDGSDQINLTNTFPITNEAGLSTTPYTFTVTNTCVDAASFDLQLETFAATGDGAITMPDDYVRLFMTKKIGDAETTNVNTTSADGTFKVTSLPTATTKLATGSANAYKVETNQTLAGNSSISYTLKAWMDEAVTLEDTDSQNSTWTAKIAVNAQFKPSNS